MCQLSVVNLQKRDLNLIADYLLSFGESKYHSDGFGIMHGGVADKTQYAPKNLTNFGTFAGDVVKSHHIVLSHIRQASTGVDVCDENSHPFESDDFLLMHNGTLVRGGEKRKYSKQESDSKIFLEELQKQFNEKKKFVDAFNSAMEKFWGKFAFLIYVKKENSYYVCRGTTANLFIMNLLEDGKPVGYIINTDRTNLETAARMISNISQIIHKKGLNFSQATLLDHNSIFKLSASDIQKIGECKENEEKDFIVEPVAVKRSHQPLFSDDKRNEFAVDENSYIYKISKFMLDNLFSPKDMALIFRIYMGTDFMGADKIELKLFADNVLPSLKNKGGNSTVKFLKKKFKTFPVFPVTLYHEYGLEFPWTINPQQSIINAVNKFERDKKN